MVGRRWSESKANFDIAESERQAQTLTIDIARALGCGGSCAKGMWRAVCGRAMAGRLRGAELGVDELPAEPFEVLTLEGIRNGRLIDRRSTYDQG